MSKHKNETVVAENAQVASDVAAEMPKTKIGDKPETTVDSKVKVARATKASRYRILDGVDISKFSGQRKLVVAALQKLDSQNPGASWPVDEIVNNVEGLVSKTPVEASVKYHLNGLASDMQVEATSDAPVSATVAA
jgi:hypothetical protein